MDPHPLHQQLQQLHTESFGWAMRCCQDHKELAEDILQTSYLKILDGKAVYKGKSGFRTWLFSVIRFTAIDTIRKHQRLRADQYIQQADESKEVSKWELEKDRAYLQGIFSRMLKQLPPKQQQVLHLKFYHDMSLNEAAVVMQISLGSARTHYHRAKIHIRTLLETQGISHSDLLI